LEISILIRTIYLTCIAAVAAGTILLFVFIKGHYMFRLVIEPSLNYSLSKAYRENVTLSRSVWFLMIGKCFTLQLYTVLEGCEYNTFN
jgi:hypothetical protein